MSNAHAQQGWWWHDRRQFVVGKGKLHNISHFLSKVSTSWGKMRWHSFVFFPHHDKKKLFSPGIFTSKLSLWYKFSAAVSDKCPVLSVGVSPKLWLQDLVTILYEVILTHIYATVHVRGCQRPGYSNVSSKLFFKSMQFFLYPESGREKKKKKKIRELWMIIPHLNFSEENGI